MSLKFARLHRSAIKALLPGGSITEHGITVTRLQSGDLRYGVNVMVDGQRIHRAIGTESDGVTREQAERFIEQKRTEAREGRFNLPVARKLHRGFAEAAEDYLKRLDETDGKIMHAKRRHLRSTLIPAFAQRKANRVSTSDVEAFVQGRLEKGFKQATVNRELATLSHFYRRMVKWGWVRAEDCPAIVKGNEPRKAIVVLTEAHIDSLMDAAAADPENRLQLFVAFGLNTAMRHSEILRVRYDQIDFDSRRIFIPSAKAGEREQPMTAALAGMLTEARKNDVDKDGWVFPNRRRGGKQDYRGSMAKPFLRAVIRAGLEPSKVTPHVMRHTAITRLVKAGIDLPTIQRISGHKTLAMVLRYVHIHGQHIDAAIAVLNTGPDSITPKLHRAA